MIRTQLLALAAVAGLAAVPAAAAAADDGDQTLATFQQLCWKTSADFPAVMQAADAGGWVNADLTADTMEGVSVTDKGAKEKISGPIDMKLLVTRGTQGGNVVRTCTLSVTGAQGALLDRAHAWLGVDAASTDAGKADYLVTMEGGRFKALAGADLEAAAAKGGVHLIRFSQDGDTEIVDYTRISK